jgi:hypothetical protein
MDREDCALAVKYVDFRVKLKMLDPGCEAGRRIVYQWEFPVP